MCGIYGVLGTPDLTIDKRVIDRMGRSMHHRGPDGSGAVCDGNLMMGMQRLAIIDVDGGQQPIYNESRTVAVVCNGEIYNFRELRQQLLEKGHRFSTNSDSEVIVHLYEEYGENFVTYLSGMFAFAVWDLQKRKLLLARDRLGIKPLYVAHNASRLIFASELKTILEYPGVERRIDPVAVQEYLALGYVPAPLSILEGIRKLPPATLLVADSKGTRSTRYWEPPTDVDAEMTEEDWVRRIAGTLEEAVRSQMVSDVPLGAFLSGGIDSSAVVAYMARHSDQPVKTYSIGFDTDTGGGYYNELPFAREVADKFKTEHHEIVVRPDVATLLPELLWHMDEPVADAAFITTYLVSRFAREDVTVILSGVGGDELFGGYRRYWSEFLARRYRQIPALVRKSVLQPLANALPSDRHSRMLDRFRLVKGFVAGAELDADSRYEHYVRVFRDADLAAILATDRGFESAAMRSAFEEARADDPLGRVIDVDLRTQLPDDLLMLTDRMSMATSLECRVPLLDDALVDMAMRMPPQMKVRGSRLKYGLKQALRGVLPDGIIDRKKRGFGAPIGGWFKQELAEYLDSVLNEEVVRGRNIIDWSYLQHMKQRHAANREDYTDHILALLNLEIWCQLYLDGDSHGAVSDRLASVAAA